MNRKEANNYIGKQIRVVDPLLGSYIGELIDIIAEPRKPWRGKIKIKAIEQYPVQQQSTITNQGLIRPPFSNGEIYEIAGSKVEPVQTNEDVLDYDQSLKSALLTEINYYQTEKDKVSNILSELKKELRKLQPHDSSDDAEYQYYTVLKEEDILILVDEFNNTIPLEDCPFEFQIKVKNKWIPVEYDDGNTFIDQKDKQYHVHEGTEIRLDKEQFDPYHLFINELEKPALDSLLNGLKKFNISEGDYVNCHNTLLHQYLTAGEEKEFKGVNFISYQKNNETVLVQHHYERVIMEDGDDITYDRFEFTNDQGRRLLMTYTTETTK